MEHYPLTIYYEWHYIIYYLNQRRFVCYLIHKAS